MKGVGSQLSRTFRSTSATAGGFISNCVPSNPRLQICFAERLSRNVASTFDKLDTGQSLTGESSEGYHGTALTQRNGSSRLYSDGRRALIKLLAGRCTGCQHQHTELYCRHELGHMQSHRNTLSCPLHPFAEKRLRCVLVAQLPSKVFHRGRFGQHNMGYRYPQDDGLSHSLRKGEPAPS